MWKFSMSHAGQVKNANLVLQFIILCTFANIPFCLNKSISYFKGWSRTFTDGSDEVNVSTLHLGLGNFQIMKINQF